MTPKRAKEILASADFTSTHKRTDQEDKFVRSLWQKLPGAYSWHDALVVVSRGKIHFEGLRGKYFYRLRHLASPQKGDWYLSGAIPAAYRAPNDLTSPYRIVEPVTA